MATLYWRIQMSLERNISSSEYDHRSPGFTYHPSRATLEWKTLLARTGRGAELLSRLSSMAPWWPLPEARVTGEAESRAVARGMPRSSRRDDASLYDLERNKQSFDRVSYMGGILLPFTVVSGVLSMSDPFGPGGDMFFVFWAVSIPLVFIAILVVYADSIRKTEVWIEVATDAGLMEEQFNEPEPGLPPMRVPAVEVILESAIPPVITDEPPLRSAGSSVIVEKMFKDGRKKRWRKERLGWTGACKAALGIYKLKKGRPRGHT
ncbi:hypothetical protein GGS23DRAFT_567264 [Durotheca rogersii]|uniref:uncharacterized protein n=1 Tax=Durotheca rogersii TaxID=419775 RepID=UPI00221F982D|nr:uncharacterized protein GGS23DRAFT_567264 [Durotheca rogersii]KAI5863483.1 hypothetical protein GGS23DRAFT_567264 [Durotheca rogersii]